MYNVLLFAGTSEGRRIAEAMAGRSVTCQVFTATEYGGSLIGRSDRIQVSDRRLTREEMEDIFRASPGALVIDATHPYAAQVTENIREAAERAGNEYVRVVRDSSYGALEEDGDILAADTEEACRFLNAAEGRALLTTGSKELALFTSVRDFESRLFARVLPLPQVIADCSSLGFQGAHLIAMQGPFSREMNVAMLRQIQADFLVTKDTGSAGGFEDKIAAARESGCRLIIIGRPREETGLSVEEAISLIDERFPDRMTLEGERSCPEIALVGIGMGGDMRDTLTGEARAFCEKADILIGASRMVASIARPGQTRLIEYHAQKIAAYLREHSEIGRAAILLSGDVGFFSGAKKLLEELPSGVRVLPGISSIVYFAAALHTSWEDAKITSLHGRSCNLVGEILTHSKVFSILGTSDGVRNLCRSLIYYEGGGGFSASDLILHVGENLSYSNEKIRSGRPEDFLDYEGDPLSVIMVENRCPDRRVSHGRPDEDFIRDKIPMTKEEIREISVCKLKLDRDSLVYDIGAGSGSLSVEMALLAREGRVWAIEKNPVAVSLLHRNRLKFCADNLEIIEGTAPEALESLPSPTHAFIGGSSGNMKEILEVLLAKNPHVRVVVNAITLETVGEAMRALEDLGFSHIDIASVSVAKSREIGRYHMMMGQNPVYIMTGEGGRGDDKDS